MRKSVLNLDNSCVEAHRCKVSIFKGNKKTSIITETRMKKWQQTKNNNRSYPITNNRETWHWLLLLTSGFARFFIS